MGADVAKGFALASDGLSVDVAGLIDVQVEGADGIGIEWVKINPRHMAVADPATDEGGIVRARFGV